ncbi:MAG: hypothetical protein J6U54_05505 [Clostridiales bacterium]|nr:hypothetical protein [Clostridiales bacterium]
MPDVSFKLEWDAVGEHLYETGVDRGVVYPQDSDGTYPAGYAWNGLTNVSESPSGAEATDLWADNIKYLSLRSAEQFGATVEAYTYPEEFALLDGTAAIATGVYIGQQPRKAFGLSYRTVVGNDTDLDNYGYKIHLVYGATCSPSEKAYQTINDSPEAITFSWEMSTVPVNVAGHKPTATLIVDSTKIDSAKLTALETVLYGTAGQGGEDARLPLPDEVLTIIA